MSQLEQAKKEATRLFKIAKEQSTENPSINIKDFTTSKEQIAKINGYINWEEYEKSLLIKDIEQEEPYDIIDKYCSLESMPVFNNMPFEFVKSTERSFLLNNTNSNTEHTPITLGDFDVNSPFAHLEDFSKKHKNKSWILDSYPTFLIGGVGSGRTECMVSMMSQCIKNNEGVFYCNGASDVSVYSKMFAFSNQYNRIDDLFVLNFVISPQTKEKISHTIDPINPIIGDKKAISVLFGHKVSDLINSICVSIKSNGGLVTIKNLESFYSLDNLNSFLNNELFESSKYEIIKYLNSIDYYESDESYYLLEHQKNFKKFINTVELFKKYEDSFSETPDISIDALYSQKKMLCVLFPCFEKNESICTQLNTLFSILLKKAIISNESKSNNQNIFYDYLDYGFTSQCCNYFFDTEYTSTNMTFGFCYSDPQIEANIDTNYMNHAVNRSKTFVLMTQYYDAIIDNLKLKIIDTIEDFPPFYKYKYRHALQGGQAYVFGKTKYPHDPKKILNSNVKKESSLSPIKIRYVEPIYPKFIYLNKMTCF